MAQNTLNTRIQLKYDSYDNWEAVKSTFTPLRGELCVVNPGTKLNDSSTIPCLMKIGNGTSLWKDLPWISATAADVYAWAKAADVEFSNQHILFKNATGVTVKDLDLSVFITADELETRLGQIDSGILSISGKEAIVVSTGSAPEVSLKLDTTAPGNVTLSQSTNGLKANVDLSDYKTKQTKVEDKITGMGSDHILASLSQDENGKITYTLHQLTPDDIGAQPAGDYKSVQDSVENKISGVQLITSLTQNNQGVIDYEATNLTPATIGAYTTTQVDDAVQSAKDYAKVTITENTDDATVAKTYVFTQNGAEIGTIKLAKELVVTSGTVEEVTEIDIPYTGAIVGDKYIKLIIANQDSPIYIPAKDLVDIYTAKEGAAEVQVAISNTNEISATLVNGGITEEKLAEEVKTKLNKTWEEVGVAAGLNATLKSELQKEIDDDVEAAIEAEVARADDAYLPIDTVFDTHAIKTSSTDEDPFLGPEGTSLHDILWEIDNRISENTTAISDLDSSVTATAADGNQVSVLTGVTQTDGKLTNKTEVKLAAIAKTGNVNDLVQTTGDVLIFNCGTATTVI